MMAALVVVVVASVGDAMVAFVADVTSAVAAVLFRRGDSFCGCKCGD